MGTPASVRHHKPFFFIWCVCVLVCVLFQGFLEKKKFSSSCTRKLHLAGWSADAVKSPARGSWGIPQFFRAFEVTVVYYSAELQHTCRRTHACVGTWSYVWSYVKGTLGKLCMEEYVCSEYLMSYSSNPYIHPSPPTSMPAAPGPAPFPE